MKTLCVTGTKAERVEKIMTGAAGVNVVITSYDLLKKDVDIYREMPFAVCVIDEAQYIKNHNTKNSRSVKLINAGLRFALSGTPIENSLAELWSVFDFIMPYYLYNYHKFRAKFENAIVKYDDKDAARRLSEMTAPFILRRLKKDVLKELPAKQESFIEIALEGKQKDVYAAQALLASKKIRDIGDSPQGKIQVLAHLLRLRQLCCSPELFLENYQGNSGKLDAALELINECAAGGHKALLFSQFTSMLAIIAEKLKALNIGYFLLQGDTRPEERLELVNKFNEGNVPIFLISLKAGGTGLNLTAADTVIHYDPWWNLSAQNQASDRAHRIGQKSVVHVYKLILKDTIEEKIVLMQQRKKDLFDSIICEGEVDITKMSKEEILSLLE